MVATNTVPMLNLTNSVNLMTAIAIVNWGYTVDQIVSSLADAEYFFVDAGGNAHALKLTSQNEGGNVTTLFTVVVNGGSVLAFEIAMDDLLAPPC